MGSRPNLALQSVKATRNTTKHPRAPPRVAVADNNPMIRNLFGLA